MRAEYLVFCRLLLPDGRWARLQVEGLAVNRVLISLDGYLADVSAADGAFW